MDSMKNPNCQCPNKECPVRADCRICRALHPNGKTTYCQSNAAKKGFMKFASNVGFLKNAYNAMVSKKIKTLKIYE